YPDDVGGALNESFLLSAPNQLAALLPEYGFLQEVLKVVDIPEASGGRILRIAMNADEGEALGYLSEP
ncbi:MAG: hypothetical protein JW990_00350, partial [Thermoleophilia bacterium]|nr:hypothetical protein [Thermoleophilia bacterium]